MDRFSRDDLRALVANNQAPCVSLLMRTTRGVGQEDKLRWKNQVEKAQELLTGQGRRTPDAKDLLAPARALLEDVPFWLNVSDGLAVFIAPGFFRAYRVPLPLDDQVVAADRFHIKPLVPLLSGEGLFYVLALSPSGLRLLQGTRDTVHEIDLHKVPLNVAEAFAYGDEPPRPKQGAAGSRPISPPPMFDTAGIAANPTRATLLEYFHRVDRGLRELLGNEGAPLVLAGPEDFTQVYRQANSYRNLADGGVERQPDQLSFEQLRDRAWEVAQRHSQEARGKVAGQYRELAGTGRTAKDVAEIATAAYQGKIQFLFADRRQEQWGTFDPATQKVDVHARQEPGDEDLVNFAVVHVLLHKGTVYAVEPKDLPDKTPLAAIFWLPLGERSSKTIISEAPVNA
jgi:hypothetical protein